MKFHQYINENTKQKTWDEFTQEMLEKYGPPSSDNYFNLHIESAANWLSRMFSFRINNKVNMYDFLIKNNDYLIEIKKYFNSDRRIQNAFERWRGKIVNYIQEEEFKHNIRKDRSQIKNYGLIENTIADPAFLDESKSKVFSPFPALILRHIKIDLENQNLDLIKKLINFNPKLILIIYKETHFLPEDIQITALQIDPHKFIENVDNPSREVIQYFIDNYPWLLSDNFFNKCTEKCDDLKEKWSRIGKARKQIGL